MFLSKKIEALFEKNLSKIQKLSPNFQKLTLQPKLLHWNLKNNDLRSK